MATTTTVFGPAVQSLLAGQFGDVAAAGALKALLLGTGVAAPSQDFRYRSELTGEVVHASYTAGGVALTGVVVTYDPATNTTMLDCNDVTFPSLTATVSNIVFYRDTGTPATSPLLVNWALAPEETSSGVNYVAVIAPEGLLRGTVA